MNGGVVTEWRSEFNRTHRWIVYFEIGGRRRYLQTPGVKLFKGMYHNRRPAGYRKATWTDDRDRAFRFSSPSAAKRGKATIVPARWNRMHFEKLEADR